MLMKSTFSNNDYITLYDLLDALFFNKHPLYAFKFELDTPV